jgi:hypothetical protein
MKAVARRSKPKPAGVSQVRPTEANAQSVEEAEREKPRRARGSDDVAGIHEESGLDQATQQWLSQLPRHLRRPGLPGSPLSRAAFLSILLGRSPIVPDVQALEVLLCRNGFSETC